MDILNSELHSSPWQPQHNWPQTRNPISCLNRISRDGRNVRVSTHMHVCRKDDIFRQRWQKYSEMGRVIMGTIFLLAGQSLNFQLWKAFELWRPSWKLRQYARAKLGIFPIFFRFFYDGSPTRQTVKNNWRTSWSWAVPSSALAGVDLVYFGSAAKLDTSWWLAGTSWVAKELENNN